MKKIQTIIKEVADGVLAAMKDAIESGYDYINYEKVYGDAAVYVDVKEVRLRGGMYIDDMDVCVYHAERGHQSPRLEQAIRKAMPDWFKVKEGMSVQY
jgi:hypothetical protein